MKKTKSKGRKLLNIGLQWKTHISIFILFPRDKVPQTKGRIK